MSRIGVLAICLFGPLAAAWADATAPAYRAEVFAGSGCPIAAGTAASAPLGAVGGVAVDAAGNVYLSDTDNHLVRKIDTSGIIHTLAGTCSSGYSGDGGPAAAAQLNQPYGVALDATGNLYVADYGNNRVRRIGADGTITTVAGNGQSRLGGEGVTAAGSPLLTPRNVVLDAAGNLYISEFAGHRVRKVTPDGKIATFAGIGIAGYAGDSGPATAAQLNYPAGLAVDRAALYIADSNNHRLRKVLAGKITTIPGPDVKLSDGSPGFYGAVGVAADTAGNLFVAESVTANAVSVEGYSAASGQWTLLIAGPAAFSVTARDVAVDRLGNLYLAAGQQIWIKGSSSGASASGASNGKLLAGGGTGIGDGGSASRAQLSSPIGLALDAAGNLHIADAGNRRVRKVNPAGQISTEAGTGSSGFSGDNGPAVAAQLSTPMGVAADSFGNLYVADMLNYRVRQVGADGLIHTVVGNSQSGLGQEGSPGTQMPLGSPQGVCTDRAGVLYVVDTLNHRVLRAAPGTGVTTAAGNGSAGSFGDGGPARLAELNSPTACALDSAGDLFITDTTENRVRKVTPDGNISSVAGMGLRGLSGDGGPAVAAALSGPRGIAVNDDGTLYIADTDNQRIRKVTPDGVIQTIVGEGVTSLARPVGLALDGSGNLYVADSMRNVVFRLAPVSAPPSNAQGGGTPLPTPLVSAVNAASGQPGPVAPGELVALTGVGLGPATEVRFDGAVRPVLSSQAGAVIVQAPDSPAPNGSTTLAVSSNGQPVATLALPVVAAAPALFPVVVNADGSVNSESHPAAQNGIITLYATGEGQSPAAVALTVAGMPAQILFAGSAPGQVGVFQINALTPGAFVPSGQVAVVLTVGDISSPAVNMWLQ